MVRRRRRVLCSKDRFHLIDVVNQTQLLPPRPFQWCARTVPSGVDRNRQPNSDKVPIFIVVDIAARVLKGSPDAFTDGAGQFLVDADLRLRAGLTVSGISRSQFA